jgi:hypothetical protein
MYGIPGMRRKSWLMKPPWHERLRRWLRRKLFGAF